ncbi:hypothetical protein EGW08_008405 [Elysia chlorotica]|uniref:Glycosyltransferase family 92 protein n=1 Tax=Elysia chlorotica TaxID=188477 RepID=A0A433TQH3_ELYCH|nr:hypothetical protein EGW08_008405 [Elysia chlorotica]
MQKIHRRVYMVGFISMCALFFLVVHIKTSQVQSFFITALPEKPIENETAIPASKTIPVPAKVIPEVNKPPQEITKIALPEKPIENKTAIAASKTIPVLAKVVAEVNKPPQEITKIGNSPDFQSARGIGNLYFVHTALWTGDYVRITAIKPRGWPRDIFCFLWYSEDENSTSITVKATVKDLQFYTEVTSVGYIKCSLSGGEKEKKPPLYVGLTNQNTTWFGPKIKLLVENRDIDVDKISKMKSTAQNGHSGTGNGTGPEKNRVVEFTVCIPAMYNYGDAAQLVEKLEMVRLLGAGRVVLYETSIGANVRSVLELYTREWSQGNETLEVVVHSWKLPKISMHYLGQLATVDDCLYRYGWLSHYMVFNDMDEIMIPLRHENWSQLIAEREKSNPGSPAFMFLCSIMNKDHSSPAEGFEADAFFYGSSILSYTQRDVYIFEYKNKGKLIVNPRKVQSLEVHHIYEANGTTDVIPEDQGLLYHYRWPLRPCDPEVQDNRVVNKFGQRLLARLKSVWSKLDGVPKGGKRPPLNPTRATCKKVLKIGGKKLAPNVNHVAKTHQFVKTLIHSIYPSLHENF